MSGYALFLLEYIFGVISNAEAETAVREISVTVCAISIVLMAVGRFKQDLTGRDTVLWNSMKLRASR